MSHMLQRSLHDDRTLDNYTSPRQWSQVNEDLKKFVESYSPNGLPPYINKDNIYIMDHVPATTERMSLKYRFYMKFLFPVELLWKAGSQLNEFRHKRNLSIWETTPNTKIRNSLKISNNLFGTEQARPLGPLVEMVGPIFNAVYDPLPLHIEHFLDQHQRVLFVAFGQHTSAKEHETKQLLAMLLHMQETHLIDGFIWGSGLSHLPKIVSTPSGNIYNVTHLLGQQHPNVRLLHWAPQFAILKHPSVITFLTHGGGMSLFEALHAGKRTIIRPFFYDQPANAFHFEHTQLGGYLNMDDHNGALETFRRVIEDTDNVIQKNVDRYQALFQIHAQRGVDRGADLVEEVLFTSVGDGQLPHRRDVANNISFLKANDYDLKMEEFVVKHSPRCLSC
ncbi:hypothetical protein BDB00DRAFT_941141 [Zychaea mexicana]|uniref:uncharacterized protein n=1 Tax=Zychaea mexicana TaxID=64656 RepID=UPI0022FDF10B|nr:uncharacterized protein BDB00DRAFT_941141 [Zychaea mexicana]KAI9490255.1 hypothetical protein BDB00DRAFT_941141 [Zychaea mexicana]